MKHFQPFFSFALSLIFFTSYAQNTAKDHVIVYNTDNYMGDMTATFDGGLLVAGYSGSEKGFEGETAFVQKFDSQHQLVWSCFLDIVPVLNPYYSIINVQVVPQKDGSAILLISRFDCDIITYDYLVGISPTGQVTWHKELIGITRGKLINWAPYACAVYNDQVFLAFGPDGQNAAYTLEGELPAFTIPLPDGRSLEGNINRVWLVDGLGQQIGNFWDSPEDIFSIDTLPGGGFIVFAKGYIFKFSPSFVLYEYAEKPDLSDYEIHPLGDGYLALERFGTQPSLLTWDNSFSIINSFKVRPTIIRYSWYPHDQNFFIQGNKVTIATSLAEGESTTIWTASFPANSTGAHTTNVDMNIKNVIYSGTPKGYITGSLPAFPEITTYQVDYTDISAEIQNAGTDTIHHFILNLRVKSCESVPWCPGGELVRSKVFEGYHLAPGETIIVPFDSIYFDCTTSDIRNCCIWVSDINQESDDDLSNNSMCRFFSGIVPAREAPGILPFSVSPNPSADVVNIQLPDQEEMAVYSIFNMAGTIVQQVFTNDLAVPVRQLPTGMYLLEIQTKNGAIGRQKLAITH